MYSDIRLLGRTNRTLLGSRGAVYSPLGRLMTTNRALPRLLARLAAASCIAAPLLAPQTSEAGAVHTTILQRYQAAKVAKTKIGRPYVWGATGPNAFDCSGLVGFAYKMARRPLPVRTSQQMWSFGKRIHRSSLKPGDLVFTWDHSHGHVGIYVGRNRYVNAPRPGRRVEIATLPGGSGFVGAVRP